MGHNILLVQSRSLNAMDAGTQRLIDRENSPPTHRDETAMNGAQHIVGSIRVAKCNRRGHPAAY